MYEQVKITLRVAVPVDAGRGLGTVQDRALSMAARAGEAVRDGCLTVAVGSEMELSPIPLPESVADATAYASAYVKGGVR